MKMSKFLLINDIDLSLLQIAMLDYHFQRYGNFIGNYFDDISCARLAGLHYVGVLHRFDKEEDKSDFWTALPSILPHSNPAASYKEAADVVRNKCKCTRYCWSHDDPMMSNMPFIGSLMRQSVYAHLRHENKQGVPLLVRPLELVEGVDMFPKSLKQALPLIPGIHVSNLRIFE